MSDIKNKVIEEIKKIYDPEIPVNIYELGLIYKIEGVSDVKLNIVWEPPWDKDKMSEAAKLELNL